MIVRFGLDLDSNPWPGPLADRDAVAGEPWVGPRGMLDLLEAQLGLTGLPRSEIHRAAALIPAVNATDGFWRASAVYDPLGVALELLRWRDELWTHGWTGQPLASRLESLAAITGAALPGLPDRLDAVNAALEAQPIDIERIELLGTERDELPRLWRRVLDTLAGRGVAITEIPIPPATQTGDLRACHEASFDPAGDGTLQLIRAQGPVTAAEQVAAWLASRPDLQGTVVIGRDERLDLALHRAGLPTTGAVTDNGDEPLLQVLPLVMELAWAPADPQLALELLLMPVGPVPTRLARGLAAALHRWPAVDSDKWRASLEKGLEPVDEPRRARVRERIDLIFHRPSPDDAIDAEAVRDRVRVLGAWIQGYLGRDAGLDDERPWKAAAAQCAALKDLVDAMGTARLERHEVQRLVEFATSAASRRPLRPAQAGLVVAGHPGAILGPARRIVWWDFHRRGAAPPRPLPLEPAERVALRDAGIALPEPGDVAERLGARWRRPLSLAGEHLLLVCPRQSETGDAEHPHPLWDEVTARLTSPQKARLERAEPIAPVRAHTLPHLPTPQPRETWMVPSGAISIDVTNSPSSIGSLPGCPLQWVLDRVGRTRSGLVDALPGGNLLKGNVTHRILELLLESLPPDLDPDAAAERAGALFDTEGPRLATACFQPGAEPLRHEVRSKTVDSAREVVRLLRSVGGVVDDVEMELNDTWDGIRIHGYADLVLRVPRAVIDFKWGSASRHYDALRKGTACQLAAYARAVSDGKGPPSVAYFITSRQELLTTDPDLFPGIDAIDGMKPAATWTFLQRAMKERLDQIVVGRVDAPGALLDQPEKEKSGLTDDGLAMAPPCRYCTYRPLCRGEER